MAQNNVYALFCQNDISKMQEIEKNTREDLERKKEELRQLVGRRYRDIIDAADNIKAMTSEVEQIHSSIKFMRDMMSSVEDRQQNLLAALYRPLSIDDQSTDQSNVTLHWKELGVQMLFDIDDMIFDLLNDSEGSALIVDATWLLQLANHIQSLINTHQLSDNSKKLLAEINFTLADEKTKLNSTCIALLDDEDTDLGTTCDAFCVLHFLNQHDSWNMLTSYFDKQFSLLRSSFDDDGASAREQLISAALRLQNTLSAVHYVFYAQQGEYSNFDQRIEDICNRGFAPQIFKLYTDSQSSLTRKVIPLSVRNFNLTTSSNNIFNPEMLISGVTNFIDKSLSAMSSAVATRIDYFDTIASLAALKRNTIEHLQRHDNYHIYQGACKALLGHILDIWHVFFAEHADQKCQQLMDQMLTDVFDNLSLKLAKFSYDDVKNLSLGAACFTEEHAYAEPSTTLASFGVNMEILRLSHEFEQKLSSVNDEIKIYNEAGNRWDTKYVQSIALKFEKLTMDSANVLKEEHDKNDEEFTRRLLVRLLIIELITCNTRHILDGYQIDFSSTNQLLRQYIMRSIEHAAAISCFRQNVTCFNNNDEYDPMLTFRYALAFQRHKARTTDSQEEAIEIELPSTVSLPLQMFLQEITTWLRPIPTLKMQNDYLIGAIDLVLFHAQQAYDMVADGNIYSQNHYMQCYMDVKALVGLVSSLVKLNNVKALESTLSNLESKIDAFDMAIARPLLQPHAHREMAAICTLYGIAMPSECQAWAHRMSKTLPPSTTISGSDTHIYTCDHEKPAARLPLIPIIDETLHKCVVSTQATTKETLVPPVQVSHMSAASFSQFYDKMTKQSWFRVN